MSASMFNMTSRFWQNPDASKTVQQRNEKYRDMASLGYDAEKVIIHTPEQMKKLIKIVTDHMEDGKMGHRIHYKHNIRSYSEYPFSMLGQNATIYEIKTTYKQKTLKLKEFKWDTRTDSKSILLKSLHEAQQWQMGMQEYDEKRGIVASSKYNGYNDYGNSYGVLECIIGKFRGNKCNGCERPHYEAIIKPNSFHVCTYCGMLYKNSNIQMVAQLRTNDEGEQTGFHHAAPGMTTDPFALKLGKRSICSMMNQGYKVRAENRIKTMIGCICDKLRCDIGDSEHHIRIWAWKKYEHYSKWLDKEAKWEGTKNKMGQWTIAASFVWMSILAFEKRIYTSTVWSISKICETAEELQQGDGYIPNYVHQAKRRKINKVRKTRPVRLETVHRYATEIAAELPCFKSVYGIAIPDIHSIEVTRGTNVSQKEATDIYAELAGKISHTIILPPDQTWDLDIALHEPYIKIEPDVDGLGFKMGLRNGDILRTINNICCPKTIDETYNIFIKQKSKKIKTEHGERIKPIELLILR